MPFFLSNCTVPGQCFCASIIASKDYIYPCFAVIQLCYYVKKPCDIRYKTVWLLLIMCWDLARLYQEGGSREGVRVEGCFGQGFCLEQS